MARFFNDYDLFEAGETWYLVKDEQIYADNGLLYNFKEGDELEIISISRESAYGFAEVIIEGHKTVLGLDELYDMVWD